MRVGICWVFAAQSENLHLHLEHSLHVLEDSKYVSLDFMNQNVLVDLNISSKRHRPNGRCGPAGPALSDVPSNWHLLSLRHNFTVLDPLFPSLLTTRRGYIGQ